jgi:AraC-like DNA-binding protein
LQRPTCVKRRIQIAEDTKLLLAREFLTDLSFRHVAESVHCSQSPLGRAFQSITGSLPNDYRRELRLRKGLFLMEDTSSDIGDIAIHVGFSSHSHFTAAFHHSFGSTPTEFVRWRAQPVFVSQDLAA